MTTSALDLAESWPPLPLNGWRDTRDTLHLWTQVAGKVRLALSPPVNHWWHVPLYVSARGLTTSPIPYGDRSFEVIFDFLAHRFEVVCSDGALSGFGLRPMPTADFHAAAMQALADSGISVKINAMPVEIPGAVRLDRDLSHSSYEPDAAQRFWRVLLRSTEVMTAFRGRFLGKSSPVHFFWGSFDLAVTRFSGREAPPHPGVAIMPDFITAEAYSHEVSSAGFWPGGDGLEEPVFYSYAYPAPPDFERAPLRPDLARFEPAMGEFVLPYEAMRRAPDPDALLMDFLQSTYEAAADLGGWDRLALERSSPT